MHASRALLTSLIAAILVVPRLSRAVPPEQGAAVSQPGPRELSLTVGVRGERATDRSELSGFLALAVPLERLAAPRSGLPPADSEPGADAPEEPPAARPRRAREPASPVFTPPELSRLGRDTVGAALRAERVPQRRSELEGMATRARASALLPELRLRAARAQDQSLRLTPTSDDPYRFTQDGGDDFVLEARATFKLDRLVFADEEIQIGRLELERDRAAERLAARIVALVGAWHRALSAARGADEASRAGAEFERLEAEMALDVATAGWFGPHAERLLRSKPSPSPSRPPEAPAPAVPSGSRTSGPLRTAAPLQEDLVEGDGSAKPAEPCLPTHVTASRTFNGVSMR
ncbi:MAG TPA: hypothetical protein VGK73_35845 [Polyangiaceae bacterium]